MLYLNKSFTQKIKNGQLRLSFAFINDKNNPLARTLSGTV